MSRKQYHTLYFALAISLINLCLCFLPFSSAGARGSNATVQILGPLQPPGFFPALLTIHVNDYVTFVNQSSPPATFTIVSDNGQYSSPALAPGKAWTIALSNPGAYEFHDAESSPRIVGEVIVVPDAISLLPTPEPAVAATALALIESGKTPPDNLASITPTTTSGITQTVSSTGWSTPIKLLMIAGIGLLLLALLFAIILLIRRWRGRRRRRGEPKEQVVDAVPPLAVTAPRQRIFARLRQRRGEDEDDLEDEDDEI